MKKYFTKTTYSILILVAFFSAVALVHAIDVPLNEAPYVAATGTRGQYKDGPLTIGSSTINASSLTVSGASGLHITGVNCAAAPYTTGVPCPYAPYTSSSTGPELHILGNGSGIGGYGNSMVVGAPLGTAITASSALDVSGTITADPASPYLNYPTGAFYSASGSATSTTLKPLCALADGDIVVCGTVNAAACGTAEGASLTGINASTPGLCASGTPSVGVQTYSSTFSWSCIGTGGGASASCSATNAGYVQPSPGGGIVAPGGGISVPGGGGLIPSGN